MTAGRMRVDPVTAYHVCKLLCHAMGESGEVCCCRALGFKLFQAYCHTCGGWRA